jgi:hypothetical protein
MIKDMQSGKFNPDMPPGEMWNSVDSTQQGEAAKDAEDSASEESDESCGEAESLDGVSSGEECGFGKAMLADAVASNAKVRDSRTFEHLDSGKVHIGLAGSADFAFCGVSLSSCRRQASGPDSSLDSSAVLCKKCFGRDEDKARALSKSLIEDTVNPSVDDDSLFL